MLVDVAREKAMETAFHPQRTSQLLTANGRSGGIHTVVHARQTRGNFKDGANERMTIN